MANPGTQEWLDLVVEDIVDPDRRIIDPHHHLWPEGGALPYGIDTLHADTSAGHNVVATVFIECHAAYRTDDPRELQSLGETSFVASQAAALIEKYPDSPPIAGIVSSIDLTLGDRVNDLIDAHTEAGNGLFRGVRDALSRAIEPDALAIAGRAAEGKSENPAFREGVRALGRRGLTYDSWNYHHQNTQLVDVARAAPDTTIILDHFGTPLGVGMYEGRRDEVFGEWARSISRVAECENVVAKLGGLAMPDNGFGWHTAERPPTSDEFVAAQARYYHHTIEAFGPERCMFESNFPVDRFSLSYQVLWNGLKKIAAPYSDSEKNAMFEGTARRVYRLEQ